jgi:hypothetical protein
MGSAERFVALLVGILTIIGALAAAIRVLIRISWQMGQLVQRFGDHVTDASRIHQDQEERIRRLERPRRGHGDAAPGSPVR